MYTCPLCGNVNKAMWEKEHMLYHERQKKKKEEEDLKKETLKNDELEEESQDILGSPRGSVRRKASDK